MKKYFIKTLFALSVLTSLSFNGCILDALNTLTQNIPISQEFTISNGILPSYSQTEIIDLSSSSTYQRYADKIQSINFVRAEYRTNSVSPASLSGNITITLKDMNGNLLFSVPLGQITPANYQNTPYELTLNAAQISLINGYLSTLANKKIQATLSIDNISPVPYSLTGVIDIVFEMKVKTN